MISPKLVTIPKTADGQLNFIGGDQVLRTPTLTRYHPSSRRSSRRPSWRIQRVSTNQQIKKSLHINTSAIQRSAISSPKLLRKFGNTCHELLQQSDSRRLLQVKQVAMMVPGLSTMSSLSSLSTRTPPTSSSTQDVEGSIPDPASIECESEDRQVRRDPHIYIYIYIFEDMMRGGCW